MLPTCDPQLPNGEGLGVIPLLAAPEGCSLQAWSTGVCVVLLGFTLAGPQIRNGVEAQPRACRLERHMYMERRSRLFRV